MQTISDKGGASQEQSLPDLLLHAFQPGRGPLTKEHPPSPVVAQLWEADSIHRANNLAQIAGSFSRIASKRPELRTKGEIVAQAELLSSIYEELGTNVDEAPLVPCATLLDRLASALITLLCDDGVITVHVSAAEVFVARRLRRALLLVASELLINAVKYAFPDGAMGEIRVTLAGGHEGGRLTIDDDGVGIMDPSKKGHGSGLIDAMVGLLGGDWQRSCRPGGGTTCMVVFPVSPEPR